MVCSFFAVYYTLREMLYGARYPEKRVFTYYRPIEHSTKEHSTLCVENYLFKHSFEVNVLFCSKESQKSYQNTSKTHFICKVDFYINTDLEYKSIIHVAKKILVISVICSNVTFFIGGGHFTRLCKM